MPKQRKKLPDLFNLDENLLDKEWINQVAHFFKYARKLARARKGHEEAKADLAVTEAELARDIRASPEAFQLPPKPPANDVVEKTILLRVEHTRARDAVIIAKHRVDVLQAYVDALDHRKKALENLVHLRAMNYFSEPVAPKVARDQTERAERQAAFGGGKKVSNRKEK